MGSRHLLIAAAAVLLILFSAHSGGGAAAGDESGPADWVELEAGLDLGRFSSLSIQADARGDLVVLRIDPERWQLRLLTVEVGAAGDRKSDRSHSVRVWCEEFNLVAAINAGMYQRDGSSHVGFMQVAGQVRDAGVNEYLSAAAFGPLRSGLPPFRIFDLDETDLAEIIKDYENVVQNLRLIKRAGENRWRRADRRWSEAALGEDAEGRILFVYCRTALSMPQFNEILLALPIDLVCAQHLEGGTEAQIFVNHADLRSGFKGAEEMLIAWPIPNAFGVVASSALSNH